MPKIEFSLVLDDGPTRAESAAVPQPGSNWLRVQPNEAFSRRRWICLRYSVGFFDDVVRPMICFRLRDGTTIVYAMNGAGLGAGEWLGRVPDGTEAVWISPTNRPGPFAFRIDHIESIPRWRIAARAALNKPMVFANAVGAKLIDARRESYQLMQFAGIAPTPFAQYDSWHRRLARPIDIAGFDRPRSLWNEGPHIRLLMLSDGSRDGDMAATIASLKGQVYSRWTLHAASGQATENETNSMLLRASHNDPRVTPTDPDTSQFSENDIVTAIDAGDIMPDHALASVVEAFAARKHLLAVYGDEDAIAKDGTLHSPVLRVDWSPAREYSRSYLGRLTCVRYSAFAASGLDWTSCLDQSAMSDLLLRMDPPSVGHVRRTLYRRHRELTQLDRPNSPAHKPSMLAQPDTRPKVSIIVPTRDRPDLLFECVRGLREFTDYPAYEVVIVDNNTVDVRARRLLQQLESQPGFQILKRPGPFNYSDLCNAGARGCSSPVLVFLNNDIAMLQSNWLKPLVAWATKPHVGVVGAKLLFSDRTIQHAGVVMGLGGICGHIYKGAPENEPGYLGELESPHEITAVTGACVAIERSKFESVGGFDAENLPVDLNDIDLCLRTSERGWTNIWTPESVLFHMESASRGFEFKPFSIYRKERDYFVRRWAHRIGDDPFFHPALSLYAHQPTLA